MIRQDKRIHDNARQDTQDTAIQYNTKQDKTRQYKSVQVKTRRDKLMHCKTRQHPTP